MLWFRMRLFFINSLLFSNFIGSWANIEFSIRWISPAVFINRFCLRSGVLFFPLYKYEFETQNCHNPWNKFQLAAKCAEKKGSNESCFSSLLTEQKLIMEMVFWSGSNAFCMIRMTVRQHSNALVSTNNILRLYKPTNRTEMAENTAQINGKKWRINIRDGERERKKNSHTLRERIEFARTSAKQSNKELNFVCSMNGGKGFVIDIIYFRMWKQ